MKNKKLTKSERIVAENLLEEASEIFDKCANCGMCKALCPVFRTLKEEQLSPRGKGVLISKKIMDKVLFECTLCKGCEQKCPAGIKICKAIMDCREAMVIKGRGLKSNKEMINNIRKYGSPFGNGEINNDKLYCC